MSETKANEAERSMRGPFLVRATIGEAGYTTSIDAFGHALTADEPRHAGGDDAGPDPYVLLLSSLAACKLMTVRMYADRKGWPLEGARVQLRHARQHARDCTECESKSGEIDRIECEIAFEGKLDDEQRSRLLEIADKCPVHKTLTTETIIHTAPMDAQ